MNAPVRPLTLVAAGAAVVGALVGLVQAWSFHVAHNESALPWALIASAWAATTAYCSWRARDAVR